MLVTRADTYVQLRRRFRDDKPYTRALGGLPHGNLNMLLERGTGCPRTDGLQRTRARERKKGRKLARNIAPTTSHDSYKAVSRCTLQQPDAGDAKIAAAAPPKRSS